MRIALFGLFGCGNSGNDASLEAMLLMIRRNVINAEIVCICPNPSVVRESFNIRAISTTPGSGRGNARHSLSRLLRRPFRSIETLVYSIRQCRQIDVLIVPGTGFLDDFMDSPFRWPLRILIWFAAARLARKRIALVSIGAGPIRGRLSKLFLSTAARLAAFRSYRDEKSKRFVASLGITVDADSVTPDLAFDLPTPSLPAFQRAPKTTTIVLGVISYFGWSQADDGKRINDLYLDKLSYLATWVLDQGHDLRLLTGDASDWSAIENLRTRLHNRGYPTASQRLFAEPATTLQSVMDQLSACDVAVVTRYHNLVCAVKMEKPAISLEYSDKNRSLMMRMGMERFSHHVETFDVDVVKGQIDEILSQRRQYVQITGDLARSLKAQLRLQEHPLLGFIGAPTQKWPESLAG